MMLLIISSFFFLTIEYGLGLPTPPPTCGISSVSTANRSRMTAEFNDYILPENRVMGGVETAPHSWPWVVQLFYNNAAKCGAAIIDNHFILTAAHCFSRKDNLLLYRMVAGVHHMGNGTYHLIRRVKIHPLHNLIWPSSYDVAIAEWVKSFFNLSIFIFMIFPPLNYSEKVQPICLPILPAVPFRVCVVAGWGMTAENGTRSEVLREIHVPILPLSICNNGLHYGGYVHGASMICAGYTQGQIDSCNGDSGGPLMCLNKGKWEIQGLVSWGFGCGRPGNPGIYTKISAVTPWIRLTTNEMNRERPK